MLVIAGLLHGLANAAIGYSGLKLFIHDLFRGSLSSNTVYKCLKLQLDLTGGNKVISWHVLCIFNVKGFFNFKRRMTMILDTMTYSVMLVIAVMTLIVILLAWSSSRPTK